MVWTDLFTMQVRVVEKVLRTVLVYACLAILLRWAGKRDLAQIYTFDLVVMLLLSNVVQNAVFGADNSLAGGMLGAAVLVAVNSIWVRVVNLRPRLTTLFEGTPTTLVKDGKVVADVHRLGLRRADVVAALRRQGASSIRKVKRASLEPGGAIVVDLKEDAEDVTMGVFKDTSKDQVALIAELRAEIRRLTDRVDAGFAELRS
jgi:uncharacterized membrane protein YcaP (DUF421 family)